MMATSEERLKVLKMVQEGKITADVASELLKALDAPGRKSEAPDRSSIGFSSKGGGRFTSETAEKKRDFTAQIAEKDTNIHESCDLHPRVQGEPIRNAGA